jgi:O-Antigen ligase
VSSGAGATSEFRLAAAGAQPLTALVPAVMVIVFGLATAVAAVLSNDLSGVVATILFGGVLMAAWVAPLRVPLLVVMFVGLAVDRPGDAEGRWASPFVTIGGLLFQNLNKVVNVEALKFSGVFVLLTCLLMVRGYRVLSGRVRDSTDSRQAAAPVVWGIVIAGLTIAFNILAGWLRGGDIQMAKIQVQAYLQLLAAAYLFGVSLRGPRDYRIAGKVIVAAACIKAAMSVWVRLTLPSAFPNSDGVMTEMEYATSHGDSLLFACAVVVLVGPLLYRPRARQLRWVLLTLPLIVAGLFANDRRIAWVQIALGLVVLVGMNLKHAMARRLVRMGVWVSPVILTYVLAGWWLPSRVFGPVHFVRSLVVDTRTDGSLDRSTLYRDAENYNLVYTFRRNPLMGTGFGHPFAQAARLDDISGGFKEFAYLPHNSMLGLWAFTGAAGFAGILTPLVIALFLAARAHAYAIEPAHALAATASMACIGAYVLHMWGDIGFSEAHTIFLVGLALAVAGQIATDTGAWPVRWRRRSTSD